MTEFTLQRYEDVSDVSGTGEVAWGVEWADGAVAVRWPGEHASTATWNDIRGVEAIHGHGGKTVVQYNDDARLVRAYRKVMPFVLNGRGPHTVTPHPDHPDRLLVAFHDEQTWRLWIALFDGSTDTAVHEGVNGEMQHRWTSNDGDLWLQYTTPLDAYPDHDAHDPRD